MKPLINDDSNKPRPGGRSPYNGRQLGLLFASAGLIYFVGTVIDLSILWILQRQESAEWVFVATSRTAEAWPRFILALTFMYAGASFTEVTSPGVYRTLAVVCLLLGVGALGLGVAVVLTFGTLPMAANDLMLSAVGKSAVLCALYVLLLVPVGWMGLRRRAY